MAITDLSVTNQAVSLLVGTINNTDDPVTFSVTPGDGNLKFPSTAGGKYFHIFVIKSDSTYEIMKVTSRTGDSMTAERTEEGTTIKSFTAGDAVALRLSAGDINDMLALLAVNVVDIDALQAFDLTCLTTANYPEWTTPAYASGDFSASGLMTWAVEAGDRTTYAYIIEGNKMTVSFHLITTSTGGTAAITLRIAIPASKVATKTMTNGLAYLLDKGVLVAGRATVALGGTVIQISRNDGAVFNATSTNQTEVYGQITFEID